MLSPIRVLDLSDERGIFCAFVLAELGADVVCVEPPDGSPVRRQGPLARGATGPEHSLHWWAYARGRRSIALDLEFAADREALLRLIDRADVVMTNVLPGRLAKFGLDADTLRAKRPSLILARMGGFAPDGPQANDPGFDQTAFFALSGLMDQARDPNGPPAFPRPGAGERLRDRAADAGAAAGHDGAPAGELTSASRSHRRAQRFRYFGSRSSERARFISA